MAGRRILIYSAQEIVREACLEQMDVSPDISGIDVAAAPEECLQKAADAFFDAVIIDDAPDLAANLRKQQFMRPILLLSSEADIESFADNVDVTDVIAKPFKLSSFLPRLYQCICQYESADTKGFVIGNFSFQPLTKNVSFADGKEIKLTEKEAEILVFLYHAKGKLVDRNTLLSEVWGYNAGVTTHTLETHMYRLRQKIDTDEENPIIITEVGGYRIDEEFLKD